MNYENIYKQETGKEATFLEYGEVCLIYSSLYVEWLEKRMAALENKKCRKTVRAKRPVQQDKQCQPQGGQH